jgi:dUTP pyrophosphatase
MNISIQRIDNDLPMPSKGTSLSAGYDLYAREDMIIPSGEYALVPTGIIIALPDGFEAQIRPRSGLAFKHGVTVLNSPGTIDADYRGEIKVLLINHGREDFSIERGMRIAQMVIASVINTALVEVAVVNDNTERGMGGFGSTGTH